MTRTSALPAPPFCPNPQCRFHSGTRHLWRWVRAGFFSRQQTPHRIQRFHCGHCGRYFSEQTFRTTYWLKRAELLEPVGHQLLQCAGYRQIARQFRASPQTIALLSARLGRHCLLFHELMRPRGPIPEPLALDSFQSFEFSQYHPTLFHVLVGQRSHFFHGFTDSELRRSGAMRAAQKRRRAALESTYGRPKPWTVAEEVARLLGIVTRGSEVIELHSDEHQDYPRAIRALPQLTVTHRAISSRAPRTTHNPLFPINLLDLLIRHSSANHKRETIAFSKRRQSAAERLWLFLVWRNYVKWFSERRHEATPAMRAGICRHRWSLRRILARRLFPSRTELPERWADYYWRRLPTRRIPHARRHRLTYAA